MRLTLLLSALAIASASAQAQEIFTRANYPASLIDRPLSLPRLVGQFAAGVDVANFDRDHIFDPEFQQTKGTGETVHLAAELGITRRLQVGAYFAAPVDPNAAFGTLLGNIEGGLTRNLNLRIDLGVQQVRYDMSDGAFHSLLAFGVGLPVKVKFHPRLAFVSGSTAANGFGLAMLGPAMLVTGTVGYFGNSVSNSAIFSLIRDSQVQRYSFQLPAGLLIQPHRLISITAHASLRALINQQNHAVTALALPIGVDAALNLVRQVDLGFSFELLGPLVLIDNGKTASLASRFAEARIFGFFIQSRI